MGRIHKTLTKGIYEISRKDPELLCQSMLHKSIVEYCPRFHNFANDCKHLSLEEHQKDSVIKIYPEEIDICNIANVTFYTIYFNHNNKMFLIDSKKVVHEDISTVLVHNLLTYDNVIQMICKILTIHLLKINCCCPMLCKRRNV